MPEISHWDHRSWLELGRGTAHRIQHFGGSGNGAEKKIKTRWKIKAGPGVALKSTKCRERIEGLKAVQNLQPDLTFQLLLSLGNSDCQRMERNWKAGEAQTRFCN